MDCLSSLIPLLLPFLCSVPPAAVFIHAYVIWSYLLREREDITPLISDRTSISELEIHFVNQ